MWSELVRKVDAERDPKMFWKEIGRMLGRRKKERMEVLKNENGDKLRTKGEVEEAFRKRLDRTFRIYIRGRK